MLVQQGDRIVPLGLKELMMLAGGYVSVAVHCAMLVLNAVETKLRVVLNISISTEPRRSIYF